LLGQLLMTGFKQIFGLALLILLSGCSYQPSNQANNKVETTDMLGRKVLIPKKVNSIVALNAGMLRLVCWLDATEYVKGVEYNERRRNVPYLYANPELREKPIIGKGNAPDPELLLALAPDLILSTYITRSQADELQNRTGIPVLAIKYGNFDNEIDTLFRALAYLGNTLNKSERATFLVDYIQNNIQNLNTLSASVGEGPGPSVYIGGIAYRGSHGITSTEPKYPPFRFLNAVNVAASLGTVMTSEVDLLTNAFIDKEQLIAWNPEYIFLDMSSSSYSGGLMEDDWITTLSAIKNDNIFTVYPYNWYTINYSTLLVNSWFIGSILYPEAFYGIDPEKKAREIYTTILGRDVYDDMISQFGTCRRFSTEK
jgi:iron complex transport system substrate-binding protein